MQERDGGQAVEMVTTFDLCLAWNWEYDGAFVGLLDAACRARGLSLLQVRPDNVEQVLQALDAGQIRFRFLLDRASDEDPRFLPLPAWADRHGACSLNPLERARQTWDKAMMHPILSVCMHTPRTIVLPSYDEQPDLPALDLSLLGDAFSVKPAQGWGGQGVVNAATSPGQVQAARQAYPSDRYLLQSSIVPVQLGQQPAWFRVIYCAGRVYPCWWDLPTHIYTLVTADEEANYGLAPLRGMAASIAQVCGLELFSTEIALDVDGLFVVVDYVNDPLDLRLQSEVREGVPDEVIRGIAECLALRVTVPPLPGTLPEC